MAKLFGKAKVAVDGQYLLVDQDAKLNLGGVSRNVVKGNDVYGYSEEAMEATIDISFYLDANTNLDTLNNISDSTVTFQADTGQTYVLAHAFRTQPVELGANAKGGKATLKLAAPTAVQV